jgi:hypothetical protein
LAGGLRLLGWGRGIRERDEISGKEGTRPMFYPLCTRVAWVDEQEGCGWGFIVKMNEMVVENGALDPAVIGS